MGTTIFDVSFVLGLCSTLVIIVGLNIYVSFTHQHFYSWLVMMIIPVFVVLTSTVYFFLYRFKPGIFFSKIND